MGDKKNDNTSKGVLKSVVAVMKSEDVSLLDKKKKLEGEYAENFDKVEECLIKSDISSKERGECMDETLDMLIRAQDNNVSAGAIIGSSQKQYTYELINARGNKELIMRICRELVKVPVFAFLALICKLLLNSMDVSFEDGIYTDIAMLDLFVPVIVIAIIANAVRFSIVAKHGVNSEMAQNSNKYIVAIQFITSILSFAMLEEIWSPESYATTFGRCLFVAIFSILTGVFIMIFVSLGGFEVIYRNKNEFDIHGRNYELMLTGFAIQFIRKRNKNKKKNLAPLTIMDYANDVLDDIELSHKFLPFVVAVLVIEIYFLGFLMLGIGVKWYLFIAVIILAVAVAICTSFIVTGNSRKNMLERIVEGQFDIREYIKYIEKNVKTDVDADVNSDVDADVNSNMDSDMDSDKEKNADNEENADKEEK